MDYKGRRQSGNVSDRRRSGGGPPMRMGPGMGIGGLLILGLIVMLSGGNLGDVIDIALQNPTSTQSTYQESSEDSELFEVSSVVLADTEDVWHEKFTEMGKTYNEPKMVIFHQSTQSGCGFASAQVGPFYCPLDQTIYLDLEFYNQLINRFGARGLYSFAYVIAHEVGHHVQNELGIIDQVRAMQEKYPRDSNKWNVALELQADYLAGVVAQQMEENGYIDSKDIESAISATEAIGDDILQQKGQGYVQPDTFTHGTAEQRTEWFLRGYKAGDLSDYNTFKELGLTN